MKAIVYEQYGPPEVLRLAEVARPEPGADEVLVEVHATALNAWDWHMLRADPFLVRLMGGGLLKPAVTILGVDIAGRVAAVGRDVTRFEAGDEVFGDISGFGAGGLAEYVAVPARGLVEKPRGLTFEQTAAVPMSAITALQGLRDRGSLQPGQNVLLHGASGGVGTFAVQIARALGGEVTAVCSSSKVEQTRDLGADTVIDYTCEDFAANGNRYDLILGINGHRPLADYRRALAPGGTYVLVGGTNAQMFEALLLGPIYSMGGSERFVQLTWSPNPEDLTWIKERLESGALKPVIDRRYPLEQVPETIRYLEGGHASGKVVINVNGAGPNGAPGLVPSPAKVSA